MHHPTCDPQAPGIHTRDCLIKYILPSLFSRFVTETYILGKADIDKNKKAEILSRFLRKEFIGKIIEKIILKMKKHPIPKQIDWLFIYNIPNKMLPIGSLLFIPPPLDGKEEKEKESDFSKPQTVCRAFTKYWQSLREKERFDKVTPPPPTPSLSLSLLLRYPSSRGATQTDYAAIYVNGISRSSIREKYFLDHVFAQFSGGIPSKHPSFQAIEPWRVDTYHRSPTRQFRKY